MNLFISSSSCLVNGYIRHCSLLRSVPSLKSILWSQIRCSGNLLYCPSSNAFVNLWKAAGTISFHSLFPLAKCSVILISIEILLLLNFSISLHLSGHLENRIPPVFQLISLGYVPLTNRIQGRYHDHLIW